MFHIRQDEVLHNDRLGAIVVGDYVHGTALGDIARLRLEGPEVTVEGDTHAGEDWQIRRADVAEVILAIDDLSAKVADDEEALAVGRHEEHRLDVEAQRGQAIQRGDACQTDGAFVVLDLELVLR